MLFDKKPINAPVTMWQDLQKLAAIHGTDLTGYLNAVVFFNHVNHPDNVRRLAPQLSPDNPERGEHKEG